MSDSDITPTERSARALLRLLGSTAVAGAGEVVPGVSTGSALVKGIAEQVMRDQAERQVRRLERLVEDLQRRVGSMEQSLIDDAPTDLLGEIVAKATRDEEEAKMPFYGALVEFVVHHPGEEPRLVRVLSDAIRTMTAAEIRLVVEAHHKRTTDRQGRPVLFIPDVAARMRALAIYETPEQIASGEGPLTQLGSFLASILIRGYEQQPADLLDE